MQVLILEVKQIDEYSSLTACQHWRLWRQKQKGEPEDMPEDVHEDVAVSVCPLQVSADNRKPEPAYSLDLSYITEPKLRTSCTDGDKNVTPNIII